MWSGEEIDEKTADIQARSFMARTLEKMGKNAKLKQKQKWSNEKWSNEKLHLENARKLPGIYFIDPEDKEFKETIKNGCKNLETPMALALPYKIIKSSKTWESGASNKIKTKLTPESFDI